jgi:hypothetical protein
MTESALEAASFADPSQDDTSMPTFVIGDDATGAVGLIADQFGAAPSLRLVRLRFGGETRYLSREGLYGLLATETKGFGQGGRATLPGLPARGTRGFGQGGRAGIPGLPVPGQESDYEFRCPVAGCPDSPVFLLAFSETPACFRHHVALVLVR